MIQKIRRKRNRLLWNFSREKDDNKSEGDKNHIHQMIFIIIDIICVFNRHDLEKSVQFREN